jgi:hypothetical protein
MTSPVTCEVKDCTLRIRARGLCITHYTQKRKSGELQPLPSRSVVERFTDGSVRKPNGCLEWTGATTKDGYGMIRIDHKTVKTARLAWELANGPIPAGFHVLHHCDNPPCGQTEPSEEYPDGHLFLGTQADNNKDMFAKGRNVSAESAVTHCPQGHPYDEANTRISGTDGSRRCRACNRDRCARNYAERVS